MIDSLDTSEADALPWVKPTQPAPGEEGAPTLTKEETALGAFLAAMHDSNLDGGKMREAMLNVLGLTATHQPAAIDTEQAKGREAVGTNKAWAIDHSAGRPILVLNGCSVIEAEDAEYVLSLIRGATPPAQPAREIAGLGRMTDDDEGFVTLQFKDEDAAQSFMAEYAPSVDVADMPPIKPAREWVGLTEDEIDAILPHRSPGTTLVEYGRLAIAAALGALEAKNAGQPVVKEQA